MTEYSSKMINILSFLNTLFLNLFIYLEYCYRENKTMLNTKFENKIMKKSFLSFLFITIFSLCYSKDIKEVEKSETFLNFLKINKIEYSQLENSKKRTIEFSKLNTTLYSYKIDEITSILIAIDSNNSVAFSFVNSEGIKLYDINGNIISLENSLAVTNDVVTPSAKCIRATALKMKESIEADDVAGSLCDLSPQCNAYIYTIAAAYCAANNNIPPKL